MGAIRDLGAETWRDFETDGVPASGPHQMLKADARNFANVVDAGVAALATAAAIANGATVSDTQAHLFAVLAPAAGTLGIVYADTTSNNGFYVKTGAAGVAGWTYTGAGPAGPAGPAGGVRSLIKVAGTQLVAGGLYGAKTGLGVLNSILPKGAGVPSGEIVRVRDVDFNAAVNNFTVNAFAGDQIVFETNAPAANFVIQTNGGEADFTWNDTYWRAHFYVG